MFVCNRLIIVSLVVGILSMTAGACDPSVVRMILVLVVLRCCMLTTVVLDGFG